MAITVQFCPGAGSTSPTSPNTVTSERSTPVDASGEWNACLTLGVPENATFTQISVARDQALRALEPGETREARARQITTAYEYLYELIAQRYRAEATVDLAGGSAETLNRQTKEATGWITKGEVPMPQGFDAGTIGHYTPSLKDLAPALKKQAGKPDGTGISVETLTEGTGKRRFDFNSLDQDATCTPPVPANLKEW